MDRTLVVLHLFTLILAVVLQSAFGQAFDLKAHEAISLRSVDPSVAGGSSLDNFLRQQFGSEFPDGIGQRVKGKQVQQWIALGSQEEDSPPQRVQQHFHDPTKDWNQAGLSTGGISSIIWAQLQNQDSGVGGGNHSWHDARESYFKALTGTDAAQRQQNWADTFESLGHLIHLVQDAASPAHTRNDLHLSYKSVGDTDSLHVWGDGPGLDEVGNSSSVRYDSSILSLPQNNFAPIPIARIFDTEKLKGGNPSEGLDIGLAEYSNANFFSDDTIFSANYQTPAAIGLITEPNPLGVLKQYLYRHPGSPTTRYKLAVASTMSDSVTLPLLNQQWELDDFVMKDYGTKLFPRAIGYSAGLIDYFFDGTVFNVLGHGWPENTTIVDRVRVDSVIYQDAPNQPSGTGTLTLVLYNMPDGVGPATGPYVSLPTTVTIIPVNIDDPVHNPLEVTFSFSSGLPVHDSNADFFGYIVWRGPLARLGQGPQVILEQDAVVAATLSNSWN